MATFIDGKKIAQKIIEDVKLAVLNIPQKPSLAVILIGNDEASRLYVRLKEKACNQVGIRFEKFLFDETTPESEIVECITNLNKRADITAILIQLPLPSQCNTDKLIALIDPKKDADGFHPYHIGKPSLVAGIITVLHSAHSLIGKSVIILAKNGVFKKSMMSALEKEGCDEATDSRFADIIITARGIPHSLTAPMIKDGCTIIDIGTTKQEGKIVGDADRSTYDKAAFVTPVPGGVGPVTVASLLSRVVFLAKNN